MFFSLCICQLLWSEPPQIIPAGALQWRAKHEWRHCGRCPPTYTSTSRWVDESCRIRAGNNCLGVQHCRLRWVDGGLFNQELKKPNRQAPKPTKRPYSGHPNPPEGVYLAKHCSYYVLHCYTMAFKHCNTMAFKHCLYYVLHCYTMAFKHCNTMAFKKQCTFLHTFLLDTHFFFKMKGLFTYYTDNNEHSKNQCLNAIVENSVCT